MPLDGLAQRFVTLLDLPGGDPEVRDIASMVQAAADAADRTDQPQVLADALGFAHGRLVVRGLSDAGADQLGAALLAAAGDCPLPAGKARHLAELLGRGTAAPATLSSQKSPFLTMHSAAYVEHLMQGDRREAVAFVRRCTTDGMDIAEVLLDILEPAQREVGRLWALGLISIIQEHFCTAVTEFVMTDLYPGMFSIQGRTRRLLAVQAPGSLHRVGLRMVTDVLECRGWSTTYLAEDVATAELVDLMAVDGADLLLISASMPSQISQVEAIIQAAHEDPRTSGVKIVVGGRPFLVAPDLAEAVGADGWAYDARRAVEVCDQLVGGEDAHDRR